MKQPKKLVGTCGTFDYIIHPGHKALLEFAADKGDELLVFIVADETVRQNKNREPYYNQEQRCNNIEALGYKAIPLRGNGDFETTLSAGLSIYVFGHDQRTEYDMKLQERLLDSGVSIYVHNVPRLYSTTELLKNDELRQKTT